MASNQWHCWREVKSRKKPSDKDTAGNNAARGPFLKERDSRRPGVNGADNELDKGVIVEGFDSLD